VHFSEGSAFYQTDVERLLYLLKFVRQRATVGAYLKIWPFLGAKIRGNFRFRKLPTTATEGIYIFCKLDVYTARGCGDIAPQILAEKRKWNRLWEFPEIIDRKKWRCQPPSTMCINLGPVGWYLTPSRAARVIFENSKIYSIFGTTALGPYGSQPAVAKNLVSPIIFAWRVKISER